ncbi:MAG: hypothetical protein WBL20_17590 [Sphingobium sp.]|uniref:hypothetical protein n=1 Tax=Sphingobium sp. TaxID=1912891 RepID=UPI003BAF4D3B
MARKGAGGHVVLRCPRCARVGAIRLVHLEGHCRQRGLRADWYVAIKLFRCGGCGMKPVKAYFTEEPPPHYAVVPISIGVPIGISPRAWYGTTDERKRKELIRRARG